MTNRTTRSTLTGRVALSATLLTLLLASGCQSMQTDRKEAHERWNKARGAVQARLASELLSQGNFTEAEAKLKEALRATPDDSALMLSAGKLDIARGAFARARQHLERVEPSDPQRAEAEHLLGVTRLAQQQWSAAAAHFEQASQLTPDEEEYVIAQAQALLQAGEARRAADVITRWATAHGWTTGLCAALAEAHEESGDWAAAAEAWSKAGVKASDERTRDRMALALVRAGRSDEAIPMLREGVEAAPENIPPAIRLALVDWAIEHADVREARALLLPLIQQSSREPGVQRRLAQVLLLENRPTEALDVLDAILKARPRDTISLELAAAIAFHSNDKPRARGYAERLAHQAGEDNPIARRILGDTVAGGR